MSTDDELLAVVLRRFMTSDAFFILSGSGDRYTLTLDGNVEISDSECKALLRVTGGKIDAPGFLGQADHEFYELPQP